MVERYMHEIDRRHMAALLRGHVGLIETPEGVQPLRMPAGDAHVHDQFSQFAAGMSSGVRLRMITDSIHHPPSKPASGTEKQAERDKGARGLPQRGPPRLSCGYVLTAG